jgi:hypothetical protein
VDIKNILPASPMDGPPLPGSLGIRWPWSKSKEPGTIIPGSETTFRGFPMRKRRFPLLDDEQTGKYYEMWEIIQDNKSWFFETQAGAETFIMGREAGQKLGE